MKSDDDVEKLFSWLQTPEIHYREFADAREIADTLPTERTRPKTAEHPRPPPETLQVDELVPGHDQAVRSESAPPPVPQRHEPATAARPANEAEPPAAPSAPASPTEETRRPLNSVFNRLSGGRASDRGPTNGRPR